MANPSFNDSNGYRNLQELTKEIRNGSSSALNMLLKLYGPALIAYSAKRTGNADVAEEIVQDIFLQLWNDRGNLDSNYNVVNYLYWLARNKSIDVIRSDSKARLREKVWISGIYNDIDDNAEDNALSELNTIEVRTQIYDTLKDAPPKSREIFMLVWDAQLTYEEIAIQLNISVRTVRNQVSRAVKILRDNWKR